MRDKITAEQYTQMKDIDIRGMVPATALDIRGPRRFRPLSESGRLPGN